MKRSKVLEIIKEILQDECEGFNKETNKIILNEIEKYMIPDVFYWNDDGSTTLTSALRELDVTDVGCIGWEIENENS